MEKNRKIVVSRRRKHSPSHVQASPIRPSVDHLPPIFGTQYRESEESHIDLESRHPKALLERDFSRIPIDDAAGLGAIPPSFEGDIETKMSDKMLEEAQDQQDLDQSDDITIESIPAEDIGGDQIIIDHSRILPHQVAINEELRPLHETESTNTTHSTHELSLPSRGYTISPLIPSSTADSKTDSTIARQEFERASRSRARFDDESAEAQPSLQDIGLPRYERESRGIQYHRRGSYPQYISNESQLTPQERVLLHTSVGVSHEGSKMFTEPKAHLFPRYPLLPPSLNPIFPVSELVPMTSKSEWNIEAVLTDHDIICRRLAAIAMRMRMVKYQELERKKRDMGHVEEEEEEDEEREGEEDLSSKESDQDIVKEEDEGREEEEDVVDQLERKKRDMGHVEEEEEEDEEREGEEDLSSKESDQDIVKEEDEGREEEEDVVDRSKFIPGKYSQDYFIEFTRLVNKYRGKIYNGIAIDLWKGNIKAKLGRGPVSKLT
ncbi:hypothetical protein ADUPG1_006746 [Aduncisulcus paluster]|uniref:Uncharacterized protein n=1 Tax=Aduncisulcus paluster TaxID=2918883 RepID=A0ABQ5KJE6_9EUKA|nr:hypothetical protein ADUPG1_006746 [Aduncisulcus paluster]